MFKLLNEKIVSLKEIAKGIFKVTVYSEYVANNILPGQFINIKCSDSEIPLLRRPMSVMSVNRSKNTFDFAFQVKGEGTEILAKKKDNDDIDLFACLGNGFFIPEKGKKIAVVGGGIGIFPLLFLIEKIREQEKDAYISTFRGFQNKENVILEEEFKNCSTEINVSTDDGSYGHKGLVSDILVSKMSQKNYDIIYTCGPQKMIAKIANIAQNHNIPCQVSLEERMGCGIGACLVCACKVKTVDGEDYKHVCKDGPVFWANEVVF